MKLLFVKPSLAWPRSSGHDVHTYHMMRACAELGHELGLVTVSRPAPGAVDGLSLSYAGALAEANGSNGGAPDIRFTSLQERYRSYWGVEKTYVARLGAIVRQQAPDAVIVAGLDALAYLPAIPEKTIRVWYAADEWVLHHLSLLQAQDRTTWPHVKAALLKGLYERAYAPVVDRAWVVSDTERRAMRWFAGVRDVDVVPNGVDAEFFAPLGEPEVPSSAVFWGRLDFEPNVQALAWFCRQVWPTLHQQVPGSRFTVIGFKPGPEVLALGRLPGVEITPDLPDLRREVSRHAVVVLPFVTGGGIKNKLLEGAALGKPIVCTRRTLSGLRSPEQSGFSAVDTPALWVDEIRGLWADEGRRRDAGRTARQWVQAHHSWQACAADATAGLSESLRRRGVQ
jgi:glycosyltransferase involved in cell wall biosynthesis